MAFSTSGYRRRRVCIGSGLRVLRNLMNHGQLQHGHSLPFRELRYEYIASIWKFDRIMVTMRNIWVYRAEFPYSEISCARPNPSVVVFDIAGERQFGPRKHTDRYGGLTF
jgi:hypothetical protein